MSGHRRRFSALQAGLVEIPVVRSTISYRNDHEAFMQYLIDANSQRKKSTGMLLREAAMRIDPKEAVQAMRTERKERDEELLDRSDDTILESSGGPKRRKISEGSMPFLEAALKVANENRDYWPLSVRQIHYRLPDDPPLKLITERRLPETNTLGAANSTICVQSVRSQSNSVALYLNKT
jgi:hypothetical protein